MPFSHKFRELVSGRQRGFTAGALRGLLRLAEGPYALAMRRRNRAFDSGRKLSFSVGVPVVSVGNLTLGGTGKTPLVEWLARWFRDRGLRVVLISRGYKSAGGAQNDEAKELAQKLPGIPHFQNPDRVAAAHTAIKEYSADVILLDDAFQHRRIRRNLDIVLIDALEPFGFNHVFPRGTLREPPEGLARADIVVLTRADMIAEAEREKIRAVVEQYSPHSCWFECRHAPQRLLIADGREEPLESLRGHPLAAFCGIGNPAGFRHTLTQCGYNVTKFREFPDHFAYPPQDIAQLSAWVTEQKVEGAVCTHKDLVKIAATEIGGKPLRAVLVGMEFINRQDAFEAMIAAIVSEKLPDREK